VNNEQKIASFAWSASWVVFHFAEEENTANISKEICGQDRDGGRGMLLRCGMV